MESQYLQKTPKQRERLGMQGRRRASEVGGEGRTEANGEAIGCLGEGFDSPHRGRGQEGPKSRPRSGSGLGIRSQIGRGTG